MNSARISMNKDESNSSFVCMTKFDEGMLSRYSHKQEFRFIAKTLMSHFYGTLERFDISLILKQLGMGAKPE